MADLEPAGVVIKVRRDGPYKVTGPFVLVDHEGNEIPVDGEDVVLCRCGASGSKPFCDRSHRAVGFVAD
ncbi:MAG: CDGSH iron-sulfur domain-containing protein [Acidimicrobiales bacterium]|jgi:CDGSH-type Zn-finger protein